MWWLAVLGAVWAADPSPGALMPGAVPVERGWWAAGGGGVVGFAAHIGGGFGWGGALTAAVSPAKGLVLSAAFVPHTIANPPEPTFSAGLSVRHLIYEREHFNLALFAIGGVATVGDCCATTALLGLGFALEGGGEVRWDLSLPFAGQIPSEDQAFTPLGWTAMLVEAGVTFRVADAHRLRVGKYPLGVGFGYRFQQEGLYVEAQVATMIVYSGASVTVGFSR